jgi:CRISPR-associated endoribonuclease Cas6
LRIYDVETQGTPDLSSGMKLFALSPMTMSTMKRVNGELKTYYMRPEDDFSAQIENNLRRKYQLVHGECAPEGSLRFRFLPGAEEKSKLISYKNTKIKGYLAPFRIRGPQELIEIGYEAGFGDKNSLGFGMAETPERFGKR